MVQKVIDFGFAKYLKPGEKTSTFCGTPEYTCPEMISEMPYDYSVDFWTLGVLTYEMLSGGPPFSSSNQNVLLKKILKEEVKYPATIKGRAKEFISQLLVKNPQERLGNVNGI